MNRLRSMGTRMMVFLLISSLLPLIGYYCYLRGSIGRTVTRVEDEFIEAAANRARTALLAETASLVRIAVDYSQWDETYKAVSTGDREWLAYCVHRWLVPNFNGDVVAFYANDGTPVFSTGVLEAAPEVRSALEGHLASGILGGPGGLYLYACSPILRSDGAGPPGGCLLLGALLDREKLDGLEQVIGCGIAVSWESTYVSSSGFKGLGPRASFASAGGDPEKPQVSRSGREGVEGRIVIGQPGGSGQAYLHVSQWPRVFETTLSGIRSSLVRTISLTIVVAIALTHLLQYLAFSPLKRLEKGISRIRERKAFEKLDEDGPPEVSSLARAFNEMAASLEEHIVATTALTTMSYTDAVSGARNYRYFHERLASEIKQSQQILRPVILGLIDINYFKFYNDAMGYTLGDEVLRTIAAIAAGVTGDSATIARLGGDDFAIILPNTDSSNGRQTMQEIAERIERYPFKGRDLLPGGRLTVSVGLAAFPDDATSKDALIEAARLDMNLARTNGTGRALRYFNAFAGIVRPGSDPMGLVASAQVLLAIVDSVDQYTYWHTQRVVRYTDWIASRMDLDLAAAETLRVAASLHDVGKIEIGREILTKAGALNADEWLTMKMHPVWGADMVRPVERLRPAASIIEAHHERFDGSGYPRGLRGREIPLGARIIGIADAFDAMTTSRPYRRGLSPESALEEIRRCAGTQFDPEIVRVWLASIEDPDVRKRLLEPKGPMQATFNLP